MTGARTAVAALALSASALLATAAPAGAAGGDPFVPPPPPDPTSDTGWQPLEPGPPSPATRACGTTIVLDDVERFFHVEERVREYAGGMTRIDYRGQYILAVRAADGRHARLDYSGALTIVFQQAKGVVDAYFRGPTVLLPANAMQAAAQRRAGLPRFAHTSGQTHIRERVDPGTGEVLSTRFVSRPRYVTNACHLLVR